MKQARARGSRWEAAPVALDGDIGLHKNVITNSQ